MFGANMVKQLIIYICKSAYYRKKSFLESFHWGLT